MVRFKPSKEFSKEIHRLFLDQKRKILKLLPYAKVKHIGSTSLPNTLTKGDLDVLVIVPTENFKTAVRKLKKVYTTNQLRNWTQNYASFKNDRLKFGLQLVAPRDVIGFTKHIRLLKGNPELLKRYNVLKRQYEGKSMREYRKAKERFFKSIENERRLKTSRTKTGIIKMLKAGHERMTRVVIKIQRKDLGKEKIFGTWTVREIVSHLAAWNLAQRKAIDEILAGDEPRWWGLNDDVFNDREVKKRKSMSLREVIKEWHGSFTALINRLDKLADEDMITPIHGKKYSKTRVSISAMFEYRYESQDHEGGHAKQIEVFLDSS